MTLILRKTMKKIFLFTALVLALFGLSSCTDNTPADIINPDADYVYFYGKTCPHCQELNAYMQEDNTLEKHSIEKREIYFNTDNQKAFQAVIQALWLEEGSTGVPFMLDKSDNKHYIGVEPIKELLKAAEQWNKPTEDEVMPLVEEVVEETEIVVSTWTTDSE